MKAIVFGASGMVGQGVVRECLADQSVEAVLVVGRTSAAITHPKLRELLRKDLFDYSGLEAELSGYDACFFCLGVTSAGMSEADYSRITHDIPVAAGQALVKLNPGMTFCFVSGAGTDSTEKGGTMWARVKGRAENALLKMGFKAVFLFRPGIIQPLDGIKSKTGSYRIGYAILKPLFPILKVLAPGQVTTTERVGRAMIKVAKSGYSKTILDNREINAIASMASTPVR